MAIQTERGQFDGSINVDGSIFQYGVEFTGGGGGGGTGDVAWASGNVGSATQLITAAGDGSIVAESEIIFISGELRIDGSTAALQRSEFNNISLGNTRRSDIQIKAGAEAIYFGVDPCITGFDTITSYIDNRTGGPFGIMTDGNEQLILGTDGHVGIGVAAGTPRLHVRESDSGGTPTSIATMVIEKNDNAILQFMTPNNQSAMIWFGDPDGANRGYIDYDHDGDFMTLQANANTNQLVLNADGTVSFSADVSVGGKVYSTDGYETGNFEIVHNTTSDSLDFNYIA